MYFHEILFDNWNNTPLFNYPVFIFYFFKLSFIFLLSCKWGYYKTKAVNKWLYLVMLKFPTWEKQIFKKKTKKKQKKQQQQQQQQQHIFVLVYLHLHSCLVYIWITSSTTRKVILIVTWLINGHKFNFWQKY